MGIKHVAAAIIAPAAVAGVALSTAAAASAATVHHAQPGKYHQWVTVRTGDTLSGIAAKHHMSWEALYATPPNMKRIHDPNVIAVGERLRIPADPKLRAAQFAALEHRLAQNTTPTEIPVQQPTAQQSTAQQSTAQQPAAQAPVQSSASPASSATGMSSFEQCVAWRESSNTPTDPGGLFGIMPSTWASLGFSGTAGQASVAQQKAAFNRLYAEYGPQPWAPSDGC